MVCSLHWSDRHICICNSHQSDCCIRVCILHQSDCCIRVCISHQSYHSIWISCTNHSIWELFSCEWYHGIRGLCKEEWYKEWVLGSFEKCNGLWPWWKPHQLRFRFSRIWKVHIICIIVELKCFFLITNYLTFLNYIFIVICSYSAFFWYIVG